MGRLQLNLTDTSDKLIERIQILCDLKTKTDVVENALLLLGWAAGEASKGRAIGSIDQKNNIYKEIHTPALEGAKSNAYLLEESSERPRRLLREQES
jgi:hypothetical protein